jgi:hypothetical protein
MKTLAQVRIQLGRGDYVLSRHAFRRVVERNISEEEIRQAGINAVIIEGYPADKYSSSCLLLGFTNGTRPLHIQVSREDSEATRIITIYQPDPDEWQDGFALRR